VGRGKGARTLVIEDALQEILEAQRPMTVRQAYYQLVSRQVIENNRGAYQAVSNILVTMRKEGMIPWAWIEDRMRRPRSVPMWSGLPDFAETAVKAYKRDVWQTQERLVELWVEKDALSGVFEQGAEPYGVTVNVGRGYDGWSSIERASERYREFDGPVSVLYFGDFDPSGVDMYRSLGERLAFFETSPELVHCALTEGILRPTICRRTLRRSRTSVGRNGSKSTETLGSSWMRSRWKF
jgi:hypothetical protein